MTEKANGDALPNHIQLVKLNRALSARISGIAAELSVARQYRVSKGQVVAEAIEFLERARHAAKPQPDDNGQDAE
jgi:hypothetical protein